MSTAPPRVQAAGIGPGAPDYVTPRTRAAIEAADVVVGFASVIGHVDHLIPEAGVTVLPCSYDDQDRQLTRFAERVGEGARGAALLMGDPNVSSGTFLGKVRAAVEGPVEVTPGVSSIQVAAGRADTSLEDSTFVTLHRRGDLGPSLARLADAVGDRHLLVLPRPFDWMPERVAGHLVETGAAPTLESAVMERLTLPGESIERLPLGDLAAAAEEPTPESRYDDLSVLVVRAEAG